MAAALTWLPSTVVARGAGLEAGPPCEATGHDVPPPWDIAVPLVRNLYRSYAAVGTDTLQDMGWLRAYFFVAVADQMADGVDGEPLYGGQDSEVSDLRVAFDPDAPVTRGMATVVVQFRNFGTPQRAVLRLRPDPEQGGAIRVFRIEHQDGWTVP